MLTELPINEIIHGDSTQVLKNFPDNSVDLIFADPPYNLQLENELIRPNQTIVDAVDDDWDKFDSFGVYDDFSSSWLSECQRVLKPSGSIWVIGSYHNIFRVGAIMMNLGFWILNDVIWHKTNPMPNFRGTRFTNATETMIWAKKDKDSKYNFNYHAMKNLNEEKQMQNVWRLPLCRGEERIMIDGEKAHSTQKPEALLYRVILSSSDPDDIVLDPFFGSGTTGAVAKKLKRRFIGIERAEKYVEVATKRIAEIPEPLFPDQLMITQSKRSQPRVPFASLIEEGYLKIGQKLYTSSRKYTAFIRADSHLQVGDFVGSIHKAGAHVQGKSACNGWDYWYYEDKDKSLTVIDVLRNQYREDKKLVSATNGA